VRRTAWPAWSPRLLLTLLGVLPLVARVVGATSLLHQEFPVHTDTQAWTNLTPSGTSPTSRRSHTAIYDPVRDRVVVFGGDAPGVLNDVWALSLGGTPAWTGLAPSGTLPSARYLHGAIYDPVRDRMVVFGGLGYSFSILGDVWTLSLTSTPAWTQLTPTGTPPSARYAHSMIYDPIRDRIVVFGGLGIIGGGYLNDVWALSLAGTPTWTEVTPTGTLPIARYGHQAFYDPVRDRMVVFGGLYYDGIGNRHLNDVWALTLAGAPSWTEVTPNGTPPSPRSSHTAVYDPLRDRMVTFGGEVSPGAYLNDVWALSLAGTPTWTALAPIGAPPNARYAHSTVYDSSRDRIIVYGGDDGSGTLDDVWTLGFGETTAITLVALSAVAEAGRVRIDWYAPGDEIALASVFRRNLESDWVLLGHPQANLNRNIFLEDTAVSPGGHYGYRLVVRDVLGMETTSSESWLTVPEGNAVPSALRLLAIAPNPFGVTGQLRYGLPRDGQVRLAVYDIQGRSVATVIDRVEAAGWRSAVWDGRDRAGRLVAPGTYFVRLEAAGEVQLQKVVLLR